MIRGILFKKIRSFKFLLNRERVSMYGKVGILRNFEDYIYKHQFYDRITTLAQSLQNKTESFDLMKSEHAQYHNV